MILVQQYSPYIVGHSFYSYVDSINTMNMDSSPGFPLYYNYSTKGSVLENTVESQNLMADVLQWFRPGPNQFTPTPIWTGTGKDELTPTTKAVNNTTRMFQNGPFFFLIIGQMLFGHQREMLKAAYGKHPDICGIQMPGVDFSLLISSFQTHFDQLVKDGYLPPGYNDDSIHQGYAIMYDADKSGWDISVPYTSVVNLVRLLIEFMPSTTQLVFPHLVLDLPTAPLVIAYYSQVFFGNVSVLGNVFVQFSNKSGAINTTRDNSMCVGTVMYPPLRDFLGPNPVEQFLMGMVGCGGDDTIELYALKRFISIQDLFNSAKEMCGMYCSSHSGYTSNANMMMFLSHKLTHAIDPITGRSYALAVPRLTKLLSSLSFKKSRDPILTFRRYYAIANGLFGYLERYPVLDKIDAAYRNHPLSKNPTPEWKEVLQTRLSDYKLASLHQGYEFLPLRSQGLIYKWE